MTVTVDYPNANTEYFDQLPKMSSIGTWDDAVARRLVDDVNQIVKVFNDNLDAFARNIKQFNSLEMNEEYYVSRMYDLQAMKF